MTTSRLRALQTLVEELQRDSGYKMYGQDKSVENFLHVVKVKIARKSKPGKPNIDSIQT